MNLEKLTLQTASIAKETGSFLRHEQAKLKTSDIEAKSFNNFVTHVDRESENRLMEQLSELIPGSGFIAEESPGLQTAEFTWIIDPLDGTTNYIHGVPLYCVSIGLRKDDKIIAGVVYEPNLDECFYTWENSSSFLNGVQIKVSAAVKVGDSLFATGFPYHDYREMDPYLDIFRQMMQKSRGIRRLGSAAADLAYVAAGRYDGFYEYGLSPWDVAAGALLVKNAGGIVTDFRGEENWLFGKQIISTNPKIHEEFINFFTYWQR
jgi:myo-inositol-1(or 4)-monophosphatase